jgi:hypothetical protein
VAVHKTSQHQGTKAIKLTIQVGPGIVSGYANTVRYVNRIVSAQRPPAIDPSFTEGKAHELLGTFSTVP